MKRHKKYTNGMTKRERKINMINRYDVPDQDDKKKRLQKETCKKTKVIGKSPVLIGMPGCGKSTLGKLLANRLQLTFLDTDNVLRKKKKMELKELNEVFGPDGFIVEESKAVCTVNFCKPMVVATGGSVVYGRKGMYHLKYYGLVIYIELPFHVIEERLGDLKERGVVLKEGQTLADLYKERCRLYRRYADIMIRPNDLSIETTVEILAGIVQFMTNSD